MHCMHGEKHGRVNAIRPIYTAECHLKYHFNIVASLFNLCCSQKGANTNFHCKAAMNRSLEKRYSGQSKASLSQN